MNKKFRHGRVTLNTHIYFFGLRRGVLSLFDEKKDSLVVWNWILKTIFLSFLIRSLKMRFLVRWTIASESIWAIQKIVLKNQAIWSETIKIGNLFYITFTFFIFCVLYFCILYHPVDGIQICSTFLAASSVRLKFQTTPIIVSLFESRQSIIKIRYEMIDFYKK